MKNLLNNKILFAIIFAVAILFVGNSNCFAISFERDGVEYSFDETVISFYNDYDYHFIIDPVFRDNTVNFVELYCTNNSTLNYYPETTGCVVSGGHCNIYYNQNPVKAKFLSPGPSNYSVCDTLGEFSYILWSDSDLYCNDTLVFHPAPPNQEITPEEQQETTQETILAEIVEQAETEKIMAEILGILPILMIILVSIIAIWKAIKLLKNVIKTS